MKKYQLNLRTQRVSNNISMNNYKITDVSLPIAGSHVANNEYVENWTANSWSNFSRGPSIWRVKANWINFEGFGDFSAKFDNFSTKFKPSFAGKSSKT